MSKVIVKSYFDKIWSPNVYQLFTSIDKECSAKKECRKRFNSEMDKTRKNIAEIKKACTNRHYKNVLRNECENFKNGNICQYEYTMLNYIYIVSNILTKHFYVLRTDSSFIATSKISDHILTSNHSQNPLSQAM